MWVLLLVFMFGSITVTTSLYVAMFSFFSLFVCFPLQVVLKLHFCSSVFQAGLSRDLQDLLLPAQSSPRPHVFVLARREQKRVKVSRKGFYLIYSLVMNAIRKRSASRNKYVKTGSTTAASLSLSLSLLKLNLWCFSFLKYLSSLKASVEHLLLSAGYSGQIWLNKQKEAPFVSLLRLHHRVRRFLN